MIRTYVQKKIVFLYIGICRCLLLIYTSLFMRKRDQNMRTNRKDTDLSIIRKDRLLPRDGEDAQECIKLQVSLRKRATNCRALYR